MIRAARIGLGGVGTVPWRAWDAEDVLRDAPATRDRGDAMTTIEAVPLVGPGIDRVDAVFHATGRHIRSLPITIDRLL